MVIDPKEIIREAINRTINQIGLDQNLTAVLTAYTFDKIQEGKNWNIAFKLQEESKVLLEDSFRNEFKNFNQLEIEDIISYRDQFFESLSACEDKIQMDRRACETFLDRHNITAAECRYQFYTKWLTKIKQQNWEDDSIKKNTILDRFEKKTVFAKSAGLDEIQLEEIKGLSSKLNDKIIEIANKIQFDKVAAIESRGSVFASTVSYALNKPFILLRKKNKLPAETHSVDFKLEYGEATIEVHKDSILKDESVLIIDDLIATGGTAEAAAKLVEMCEAKVAAFVFVINLFDLGGSDNLIKNNYKVENLIDFPGH